MVVEVTDESSRSSENAMAGFTDIDTFVEPVVGVTETIVGGVVSGGGGAAAVVNDHGYGAAKALGVSASSVSPVVKVTVYAVAKARLESGIINTLVGSTESLATV